MNLTRIRRDEEVIEKHFLDALGGLKGLKIRPGMSLLDLGAGAGFPGLPLKIYCPELHLTLVESSGKKAAFLHHLCGVLGLQDVSVLNQRVEDLSNLPERYDRIVARAFAKPEAALAFGIGLLKPKGRIVLYLSGSQASEATHETPGWLESIPYNLPFSGIGRRLEVFGRPGA